MTIDPVTTTISDLTDEEAASLRSLCEDMLRGPVALDHPLYVAFMDVFMPDHVARGITAIGTTAFLPRALHALLMREREACARMFDGHPRWSIACKDAAEMIRAREP